MIVASSFYLKKEKKKKCTLKQVIVSNKRKHTVQ